MVVVCKWRVYIAKPSGPAVCRQDGSVVMPEHCEKCELKSGIIPTSVELPDNLIGESNRKENPEVVRQGPCCG